MPLDQFQQYIPLLAPVILIELGLMIAALVDLIRQPRAKGPKWIWALVIVLINFIGPIAYFVAGREENDDQD